MPVRQESELFAAIRSNDIRALESILATESDDSRLLSADDLGFHLLRKSIEYNRTEITHLLLSRGCRAGSSSSYMGDSPLHLVVARKRNCRGLVKKLLDHGAKVAQRNRWNETALHLAFDSLADDAVVQLLLEAHLEKSVLNETNGDGLGYLHIACATADLECVRKFVEYGGADVNAQVRLDCESAYAGNTPLHMAVEFGRFDVVEYLLGRGASIYTSDREGSTPIHSALELRRSEIIELLFRYDDAGLNCVNKSGLSHFMAACVCDSLAIAQDFLADRFVGDQFLHVNEVAENGGSDHMFKGFTPLHFAATFGRLDTVKYLLASGADCCAVDHGEMTPAQAAAKCGYVDAADLIIAHCQGYNWF